ncbi:glycoside hydrolase family 16 protein [Medicago truncatula]|uniref:Glycoside hydrolase family 16 protein n=1 Tax=Medicago truncatula TaxID=3880 RepID=A0A072UNI1_MEDTR|nr:glycoside hydrolase family 16 protein [Medicago truncatula]
MAISATRGRSGVSSNHWASIKKKIISSTPPQFFLGIKYTLTMVSVDLEKSENLVYECG